MTTSSETALLDTNVLVDAVNADNDHSVACRGLLDRAAGGAIDVCVAQQVLFEYFAVITNPRRVSLPLSAAKALSDIERFANVFPVLAPPEDLHSRVCELIRSTGRSGRHVFDLALAATMLAHGVSRIFTYDTDFAGIPGITALAP